MLFIWHYGFTIFFRFRNGKQWKFTIMLGLYNKITSERVTWSPFVEYMEPALYRKVKMCGSYSREVIAPSLHIISNLKCRSGDLAHASRMFSADAAITNKQNKTERERSMQWKGDPALSFNGANTATRKHSFKNSAFNGRAKGGNKKRNCGYADGERGKNMIIWNY